MKAGDILFLNGEIITLRDAAHKRLNELSVDLNGKTVYYAGPVINGGKITSCGPTTSARTDIYVPQLLKRGVAAVIGKGERSEAATEAMRRAGATYFAAVGGAGAFYALRVISYKLLAFPELGAEAVYSLTVKNFPVIVAVDNCGNSVYNNRV